MNFEAACIILRADFGIRRYGWTGDSFVVMLPEMALEVPVPLVADEGRKKVGTVSERMTSKPVMAKITGTEVTLGWVPQYEDIVASDWTVAEDFCMVVNETAKVTMNKSSATEDTNYHAAEETNNDALAAQEEDTHVYVSEDIRHHVQASPIEWDALMEQCAGRRMRVLRVFTIDGAKIYQVSPDDNQTLVFNVPEGAIVREH